MELKYVQGKIAIENKIITTLDKFVLNFTKILEEYVDYVIVSGYVVILFGRARGTEDIDTIIRYIDSDTFASFYQKLSREGYYFLNPEDVSGLYEMLEEGLRVRIAKEDTIIPNIELKFVKDDFDNYAIDNRLEVVLGEKHLFISPIELQIPYKLYLGGDKDIEDAMYLWDIFRGKIEVNRLRDFMNALNVRGEEYGIEV
ncbi:hypothetical protein C5S35_12260 [Candidatus Methanophagaceae archaeon]|nr:MAG: hypothetical protein C5S38_01750 [Methanophagales archaeon]KAF5435052.1 hypothetical protein C5S35_12260 [Methanophagales archaeon]KAF5435446.1 hypothetical protein C5S36_03155 [Methanophagales archaeon]